MIAFVDRQNDMLRPPTIATTHVGEALAVTFRRSPRGKTMASAWVVSVAVDGAPWTWTERGAAAGGWGGLARIQSKNEGRAGVNVMADGWMAASERRLASRACPPLRN
jgi:hypothetical protein